MMRGWCQQGKHYGYKDQEKVTIPVSIATLDNDVALGGHC